MFTTFANSNYAVAAENALNILPRRREGLRECVIEEVTTQCNYFWLFSSSSEAVCPFGI